MQDFLFIRMDKKYIKIKFAEIAYIEALQNYIRIVTIHKTHLALLSLKEIEKVLPSYIFCRVHRSYIVSLDHTVSFDSNQINVNGKELPISEQYRRILTNHSLVINRNGKR